jgi:hypothetical protein
MSSFRPYDSPLKDLPSQRKDKLGLSALLHPFPKGVDQLITLLDDLFFNLKYPLA